MRKNPPSAEQRAEWNRRYYDGKGRAKIVASNAAAKERNRAFIRAAKDTTCTDCGVKYPFYVMQFDHIGTDKEYNIGRMVTGAYSIARIQKEIDKCEVVCANCHAVRTYERMGL